MAICPACDGELDLSEHELGDMVKCLECGAQMEILSLSPPVLELMEHEEDDDLAEDDDSDEDED